MSSGDRRRPRFSQWTLQIGGGREPNLRREAIVIAMLDVCGLTMLGVGDFQRARTGNLTAFDIATHMLVVLSLAYSQLLLWWRVYVRLRRGEDIEVWSPPALVRRVWGIMSTIMVWGFALLVAAQLARGLQTGQPDWLGIGAVAVTLWFFRSLALAQFVGLPGEGASAVVERGDDGGRSEVDAPEPGGV
ncbi:MAG: hypothetical protein ACXWQR_11045 [Ktedonobacterales bacterium]